MEGASSSDVFDFAKKDKPTDNLANFISNTLKTINTVSSETVEGFGTVDVSRIVPFHRLSTMFTILDLAQKVTAFQFGHSQLIHNQAFL